jgi:hypothetical protein
MVPFDEESVAADYRAEYERAHGVTPTEPEVRLHVVVERLQWKFGWPTRGATGSRTPSRESRLAPKLAGDEGGAVGEGPSAPRMRRDGPGGPAETGAQTVPARS